MLIAHLSDLHVTEQNGLAFTVVDSTYLFQKTLEHVLQLPQTPDCIVITGDLATHGKIGAYQIIAEYISMVQTPIFIIPGNHDNRENLLSVLGQYCPADPLVAPHLCFCIDKYPLRLLFVDSTQPNSHSGHCVPAVAQWIEEQLSQSPHRPTLLFTHHPPFLSALGQMDEVYENADGFMRILQKFPKTRLCCGHLHRGMFTSWHGIFSLTAPPVSAHIIPDFSPNGGDAFIDTTPAYLLHHFFGGQINSHVCHVTDSFPSRGPFYFSSPPK